MEARVKEKLCIEFSNQVRQRALERDIIQLKTKHSSLYFTLFGKKDFTKKINQLKTAFSLKSDAEASEVKLFSTLWNDKGLAEYTLYNRDEQRHCIFEWVKILYGKTAELEKLVASLQAEQQEYYSSIRKESPTIRISFVPIEVLLPEEIDKKFGNYIP